MSIHDQQQIRRSRVGEIPLLQAVAKRLGFREVLSRYIRPHGNERIPAVDTLLMLACNLATGRRPLYDLQEWVLDTDERLWQVGHLDKTVVNDDRFGRALDKLYEADRATIMTELVVRAVKETGIKLNRLHNDSTSVKAFGKIGGVTKTGLFLAKGHSKDHRPDLKQLIYTLTIAADGAVPVHCKCYPGNTTDDTTHIATWKALCQIAGRPDFLYVADRKLCTDEQLAFIVDHGGRALTVMPETWKETTTFKARLRSHPVRKNKIWERFVPGRESSGEKEYFSCFCSGTTFTKKRGYALHWIYSSEKKKRDREQREHALQKVERELSVLTGKLNKRRLKTRQQIEATANDILERAGLRECYHLEISEVKQSRRIQVGRGRPGPHTQFKTILSSIYSLGWTRNEQVLAKEKKVDGVFPLLCTDPQLTPKEALVAYKYQPRLEKRFTQFKSMQRAAPLLFKKIERVEAIMFVFFLSLMLQAVLERTLRERMKAQSIKKLNLYPEAREAAHPTTAIVIDRFEQLSKYELMQNRALLHEFKDELTPTHKRVLKLLGITEGDYWP